MTTTSTERLLAGLDADYRRLRDLAERAGPDELAAKVPTCPEWTVADLEDHVATDYLHKAETMRLGAFPEEWPPQRDPEPPAAYLRRAYEAMAEQFASRAPGDHATTWYPPDQTVGFWIRRMAHESVIHRIDGELSLGADRAAIPEDLAIDGIDEVLTTTLVYSAQEWPEDFEGGLPAKGETALLRAADAAWLITFGEGVTVDRDAAGAVADVTLTGDPASVLLWVWRRADAGTLTEQGNEVVAAKLREFLRCATQ
jgi:uncharacterized protein (TIGR03083 family)